MKLVSLFSGCGGLDLGLKNAGFEILWANDFDKNAAETYKFNLGDIVHDDITKIDENTIPDCDVIAAGFPCQPFSSAGNRGGKADPRGTLFADCIRIIGAKNPKVVIFENVRGIMSIKNKDGSLLKDEIIKLLESAGSFGYTVKYQLLKAELYGVPQKRSRVFFIGIRKDQDVEYHFPLPTHSVDDERLKVGHVISVPPDAPNQNEVWELSPQYKLMVPHIKEGGSWKDIPYELLPKRFRNIRDNMKKYRSPNFYRRFARHEINGTITAAATPENCGILHPLEDRRYSVREVARFQTFPDDFVFIGKSIAAKYRVIGNAVPPVIARAVGDSIIATFDKNGTRELSVYTTETGQAAIGI